MLNCFEHKQKKTSLKTSLESFIGAFSKGSLLSKGLLPTFPKPLMKTFNGTLPNNSMNPVQNGNLRRPVRNQIHFIDH